ncbi:hypothetical protein [Flavobacterium magnum]|nr:hypothetical protein [Flavobacterium magnum]
MKISASTIMVAAGIVCTVVSINHFGLVYSIKDSLTEPLAQEAFYPVYWLFGGLFIFFLGIGFISNNRHLVKTPLFHSLFALSFWLSDFLIFSVYNAYMNFSISFLWEVTACFTMIACSILLMRGKGLNWKSHMVSFSGKALLVGFLLGLCKFIFEYHFHLA